MGNIEAEHSGTVCKQYPQSCAMNANLISDKEKVRWEAARVGIDCCSGTYDEEGFHLVQVMVKSWHWQRSEGNQGKRRQAEVIPFIPKKMECARDFSACSGRSLVVGVVLGKGDT